MLAQDLSSRVWHSSSRGEAMPADRLAVPHAARALAQLVREHGRDVERTTLARALSARVRLAETLPAEALPIYPSRCTGGLLRSPLSSRALDRFAHVERPRALFALAHVLARLADRLRALSSRWRARARDRPSAELQPRMRQAG